MKCKQCGEEIKDGQFTDKSGLFHLVCKALWDLIQSTKRVKNG